jgi:hypothetical protein
MKKITRILFSAFIALSVTSCEELENAFGITLEPTFEETMSIDFPDTTRPGETQTMYILFTRKIDLHGAQAPEELRGQTEALINVKLEELYIAFGGVIGEEIIPKTLEGYITFIPGDTFDEKTIPGDTFDPQFFPSDTFDPQAELGTNFGGTELIREELEFTYIGSGGGAGSRRVITFENGDGEGKYQISLSKENIEMLENRLLDDGEIAFGLALEYNGDMPFGVDVTLGMQFELDASL